MGTYHIYLATISYRWALSTFPNLVQQAIVAMAAIYIAIGRRLAKSIVPTTVELRTSMYDSYFIDTCRHLCQPIYRRQRYPPRLNLLVLVEL